MVPVLAFCPNDKFVCEAVLTIADEKHVLLIHKKLFFLHLILVILNSDSPEKILDSDQQRLLLEIQAL